MPEMGVRGHALVTSIEPCPEIPQGEGRLVTGTFRHSRGIVYDLWVEGEQEPLGVTGTHPFWSVDRDGWVCAKDLKKDERLQALDGTTPRAKGLTLREEPEEFFNIEVDGDHVYRVGRQGLLLHNGSSGPNPIRKATEREKSQ